MAKSSRPNGVLRQRVRWICILVSFLLFPLTVSFFSPAIPINGALEGLIAGSLIVFTGLFVSSLFFGRAFCGWLCPGGGAQDVFMSANERKVTRGNSIKYIIWGLWITALGAVFVLGWRGSLRIDVWYQTLFESNGGSPVPLLIVYYGVITLIFVLSVSVGKRSFCHHVCWMAPFMVLGQSLRNAMKYPALRLAGDKENCRSCGKCAEECPMSLNPEGMLASDQMFNQECILCARCADACSHNALRIHIKKPD